MNKKNLADLVIRQSEFKGEMGVARADITPPPNIYSRSWGSALHDAAEGIHRPLVTTCLFFRGGDPKSSSICSASTWAGGTTSPMSSKSAKPFWKNPAFATISFSPIWAIPIPGPITNLQNWSARAAI
jgi:hypothetical protein